MKNIRIVVLISVLVLSIAALITACSSGGGGGSSSTTNNNTTTPPPPTVSNAPTSVTTTTQGAQAGTAGVSVAQSVSSSGGMLSSLVSVGGHAPKLKLPFASSAAPNKAVARLTSKVKPISLRAKGLRSSILSAGSVTTITQLCDSGSETMTMDMSNLSDITMVMNNCRTGLEIYSGTIIITATNMTIGTTASPFVYKTCSTAACASYDEVDTTVLSVSYQTSAGLNSTTDTMTADGYIDSVDNTLATTDHITMTSFRMVDVISQTTAALYTGGTETFDVDDLTLNGSVSTSHTETNNNYGESDTFQNFNVKTLTDSGLTTAYYSLNGTFAIALNPSDKCIEGTFSFTTTTPLMVKTNVDPEVTVAGDITVNGAHVVFTPAGLVNVTVSGTTISYTQAQLNSLCAL